MKFKQFFEDYDVDALLHMFADAFDANQKNIYNKPLITYGENPQDIMRKISLKAQLFSLIQNKPAAIQAIQDCERTNVTVGSLAGMLSASLP